MEFFESDSEQGGLKSFFFDDIFGYLDLTIFFNAKKSQIKVCIIHNNHIHILSWFSRPAVGLALKSRRDIPSLEASHKKPDPVSSTTIRGPKSWARRRPWKLNFLSKSCCYRPGPNFYCTVHWLAIIINSSIEPDEYDGGSQLKNYLVLYIKADT